MFATIMHNKTLRDSTFTNHDIIIVGHHTIINRSSNHRQEWSIDYDTVMMGDISIMPIMMYNQGTFITINF